MKNCKNGPGTMKNQPGTVKNHEITPVVAVMGGYRRLPGGSAHFS